MAILIKFEVIALEDMWAHIEYKMPATEESKGDEIEQLLEKQVKGLDYQYNLMFKTIMNAE